MAAESCRAVQGNSRESDEVHSVSSVLNRAVGTTGATVISLRLFRLLCCEADEARAVRPARSRVVPRNDLRPCL